MQNQEQPIVRPTRLQGQRRIYRALQAQVKLEEFARLVRDMRERQVERGFGRLGFGLIQDLEFQVDHRIREILEPEG